MHPVVSFFYCQRFIAPESHGWLHGAFGWQATLHKDALLRNVCLLSGCCFEMEIPAEVLNALNKAE